MTFYRLITEFNIYIKLQLFFCHYRLFFLFRSVRHGFARYAVGGLVSAAKTLFDEDIKMNIIHDSSTTECKCTIATTL